MPDKLTDSEIVKALPKMLNGGHGCKNCKYDDGKGDDRCGLKGCKIARYALDLINRQKAKIEELVGNNDKLNIELQSMRSAANSLKMHYEEVQVEIERLQNILICFMDALGKVRKVDDIDEISLIPLMSELNKQYRAELKAEAYKECVEKVKEYIDTHEHLTCEECECVPISKNGLDNLLKELVGDNNG